MIQLKRWERSGDYCPSDAVRAHGNAVDAEQNVPLVVKAASYASGNDIAFANPPSEDAGRRIIGKKVAKPGDECGRICNSHEALQLRIGERPVARLVVAAGLVILASISA